MNKTVNYIFIFGIFISVLSISMAMERPFYYIGVLASLIINIFVWGRTPFDNKANILLVIIITSSLGLVNFLLEVNGDNIRYTSIQTITFFASSIIQYLLYALVILNTSKLMESCTDDEKTSFYSLIILVILSSRVFNIYLFDDKSGAEGHYYLGYYLILLLPLLFFLLLSKRSLTSLVNMILVLLIAYACFSLYMHRAVIVIFPIIVFLTLITKFSLRRIFLTGMLVAIIFYNLLEYIDLSEKYFHRLNRLAELSFSDTSSNDRIARFNEMFTLMVKYPLSLIIGFSPGASESLTSTIASHSAMFGFLFDVGLINFIIYITYILLPILKVQKSEFTIYLRSFFLGGLILSMFYYAAAFPVSEIMVIDFTMVFAVSIGMLHSYRARS